MTWLEYLRKERADKLKRIEALGRDGIELSIMEAGVRRDITEEQIDKLKADVAEIEEILREEGIAFNSR